MREFFQAFCDTRNFPCNLWILVMLAAGIVTGVYVGEIFTVMVFTPGMPAWLGGAVLTLLLWFVSLVPLYFYDLPMQKPGNRAGVAGSLALAGFCSLYGGEGMAEAIDAGVLKPLCHALFFYFVALGAGFMAMHEQRDKFEPLQDSGPGIFRAFWGRILGLKLPGVWAVLRRRILPLRKERV